MTDKAYWVALATTGGIGPRTFAALVERFGSPRAVFDASENDLTEVPRVTAELAIQLRSTDMDQVENELYALAEENISVLTLEDKDYPPNLAQIPDAPPVLYLRGAMQQDDTRAVAIVGTREASEGGRRLATQLAYGLAERGFTIVSGLARGIDTAAHIGALDGKGRTLAVLGSGIRVIHPRENAGLAETIANGHGAVLSEFQPNAPPKGPALMTRDRVISGLARGVIVVEAALDSGSMDTASRAKRQGRWLLAVSGGGAGNERLINGGAQAIDVEAVDWDGIVAALDAWSTETPRAAGSQMPLL
ncbi:MAG: DNA protecting protein DprA [Chloroflexi bacterium RBG_16_56_8]|nr:MAG: DNA protecting protein DprA [Chloroflexi bacterium RBG_16_56_8]